ncbi:hypothetical protein Mapa_001790 [Marchantia paleacea]|nr:hypothetical protein Mapa_001790 [Marchantia paleacea]
MASKQVMLALVVVTSAHFLCVQASIIKRATVTLNNHASYDVKPNCRSGEDEIKKHDLSSEGSMSWGFTPFQWTRFDCTIFRPIDNLVLRFAAFDGMSFQDSLSTDGNGEKYDWTINDDGATIINGQSYGGSWSE